MDFDDHPLWKFSLAVYGAPGVAAACLDLQDRRGADVNLVLFAAFVGWSGRGRLARAELGRARAAVAPWTDAVVTPLRRVRRALKSGSGADLGAVPAAIGAEPTAALRRQIAALELEAEKLVQRALAARLEGVSGPGGAAGAADARANVEAYLTDFPSADPIADAAAVRTLIEALPPSV